MTTPAGTPAGPSTTAMLFEVLHEIHRHDRISGILTAAAGGLRRFGVSCHIAALIYDAGTDSWFITALIDPGGCPVAFERLGLPSGPFRFQAPATPVSGGLSALFGDAWGLPACTGIERSTGATIALCVPGADAGGTQALLVAFVAPTPHTGLIAGMLTHAATATLHILDRIGVPRSDGVLGPVEIADAAGREIARAERYRRDLTIVLFSPATTTELARFGPGLARMLRRWDLLGRLEADRPLLVAVLPETARTGGRGLVRRLGSRLRDIGTGIATLPEDGSTFERLLTAAHGRILSDTAYHVPAPPAVAGADEWARGIPTTAASDAVLCPRCLVRYTRYLAPNVPEAIADAGRDAARAALRAECPRHGSRFTARWC